MLKKVIHVGRGQTYEIDNAKTNLSFYSKIVVNLATGSGLVLLVKQYANAWDENAELVSEQRLSFQASDNKQKVLKLVGPLVKFFIVAPQRYNADGVFNYQFLGSSDL